MHKGGEMHGQTIKRVGTVVAAGLVLLGLWGSFRGGSSHRALAQPEPVNVQTRPQQTAVIDAKLIEANTGFSFKLFSEILQQDGGKNVFVSPSSVAIALAMTYTGASGDTRKAMAKALELQGMDLPDINQAYADLKTTLETADPEVQLNIANSLWARQGIAFKRDFLQVNREFYDAEITDLDFSDPASVGKINNWVQQKTNGKINQVIDQLQPSDILFLINAIYFKGKWTDEFDKNQTEDRPFYLTDGSQKNHPLMRQWGNYRYYETDQFQAVSLPYSQKRLSLYVFLPREDSNLDRFYQQLNAENWQQWMSQFRNRDGSIGLPRFKMEYEIGLNPALTALGMGVAFDPNRADFTAMSDVNPSINAVKHKTFVEVNEEGTEAAAVTVIGTRSMSAPISSESPFEMIVDRPFFCAIRDNRTGTLLFLGSISNPQS